MWWPLVKGIIYRRNSNIRCLWWFISHSQCVSYGLTRTSLTWLQILDWENSLSGTLPVFLWQREYSMAEPWEWSLSLPFHTTWCPMTWVWWDLWSSLEEGQWVLWIIIQSTTDLSKSICIFREPVLTMVLLWVLVFENECDCFKIRVKWNSTSYLIFVFR